VGEIGFSRDKFLYGLKWWEIKAIIDGYRKRERTYLLMTRWSTFMIMCTGMADLKKSGIHSATDLMTFPWEIKRNPGFSPEEMAEIDKMLNIKRDDG
jgi:hypothetical protein